MKEVAVLPPPGPEEVQQTLAGRTAEVEERVRAAYAKTLGSAFGTGLALASVGGFGRRELFPHSDVDLLLLVESDKSVPPREAREDHPRGRGFFLDCSKRRGRSEVLEAR